MPRVEDARPWTVPVAAALAALAAGPPLGAQPAGWALDSAALVYTSRASGNADLWMQQGGSGTPRNLTSHEAQDHVASWFPDGLRLAFQTTRDGQREIYVLRTDGSELTNLTRHGAQDLLPDVSPDGRRIVFFSDRGIEHGPRQLPGHLYVMSSEGGEAERLTGEPLTSTFGGDWSPDGRSILFARDFDGDIDLVIMDLESRRERRLPGTAAAEYGGRFSPDGRRIAFHASGDGDEARIVILSVDGTERREITRGSQHYDPHWSPDGGWLMFSGADSGVTQFDLMVVHVSGGPVRGLVATGSDERGGSWSPVRDVRRRAGPPPDRREPPAEPAGTTPPGP